MIEKEEVKKALRTNQSLAALCVCMPVSAYLCSSAFQTHSVSAFRHVSWDPGVPVGCSQHHTEAVIRWGHHWAGDIAVPW